jgi:DNA polymerase III delta prime subunit
MVKIDENILQRNNIFLGDRSVLFNAVKEATKKIDDVLFFEIEKLNISVDDIRRMISFANKSSESVKIIMLSSFYWAAEAQNAMLKVLEETPANTFIYLFGLREQTFLQTILSRVQRNNFKNTNRYLQLAVEVLQLAPNERLEQKDVKKILGLKAVDYDFEKNKENEKKDRESHILFLYALLEKILEKKLEKDFTEKLLKISTLAEIEGGSPHLFIEWLLLTTPVLR